MKAAEGAERPVCFSQHWMSKLGVRSLRDCRPLRSLARCDNSVLLQCILRPTLIYETSAALQSLDNLLIDLKSNFKIAAKGDFRDNFPGSSKVKLEELSKSLVVDGCLNAIFKVLPGYFFGHDRNRNIFKKQLRDIIYSMQGQHFMMSRLISKWDEESLTWCTNLNQKHKKDVLCDFLFWIFKCLLTGIITVNFYVTTTKCSYDERRLFYFPKNQWQRFQDQKIQHLINSGIISRYEPYCLGNRAKVKYSALEKQKSKQTIKGIPKLHIVLKNENKFRPIVRYKVKSRYDRNILERAKLLKLLIKANPAKIENEYIHLFKQWVQQHRPKLYFIKADLSDAFGSIDRQKLISILSECHKNFQKKQSNSDVKRKVAHQYKLLISDLRRPLLVRCGSTVYEWNNGLVQGLKFSPALSELYYNHLDELYLSDVYCNNDGIQLFKRVVDDYLFISDSLPVAIRFMNGLSNYKNLNYSKTVANFVHKDIKQSHSIIFLGYLYDPSSLQVGRSESVYVGQMCYKIAFTSAIANTYKFIENRIGLSGMPINAIIFNLHYSDEESLWYQIFVTLCLSANKFCSILSILSDQNEINKYLDIYKKKVCVRVCNAMIETISRNKPSNIHFNYCINHFRHLAYKALYLFAKNTQKCSGTIPDIRAHLAKTNCMSGRWNEHASKIDSDGMRTQTAVKEICRRPEFKNVLKNCDRIPTGFECYKPEWKKEIKNTYDNVYYF